MTIHENPDTVSKILSNEFAYRRWSVSQMQHTLELDKQQFEDLMLDRLPITPILAMRLEKATALSAALFLRIDYEMKLRQVEFLKSEAHRILHEKMSSHQENSR